MLTQIIYAFEAAHQRGEEPRIEAFLNEHKIDSPETLLELLYIDLEYRLKKKLPVDLNSYLDRFPQLLNSSDALKALIQAEFRRRRDQGEAVTLEDYRQRFPQLGEGLSTLLEHADSKPSLPLNNSASHDLPVIANHEILGELGRGGMAIVYKARHRELNRLVAIKMILAGSHAGSEERERFRAEARTVAGLQHPHFVQIYDVGEHEGRLWLGMEFCEGGSLADHLAGVPQPPREAAQLVETLAKAMDVAHQANVIHRDLKPANVLLVNAVRKSEDSLVPKIADFGLAKKLDTPGQTVSGMIVGTPSYMAPEQAQGHLRQIGPTTDVYALGAILYECLTGRPPFRAATTLETIVQVINDDPVTPRTLVGSVPTDLETICLKALDKNPARRYPTSQALADDLRRYLNGEPIQARPITFTARSWKWMKRHPGTSAGILSSVSIFLVGFALVLWQLQRVEAARADEQYQRELAENAEFSERTAKEEKSRALEKEKEARQAEENQKKIAQTKQKEAEDALDVAEANEYRRSIALAQREYQQANPARMQQLLESCPGKRRNWEWNYLQATLMAHQFAGGLQPSPILPMARFGPGGRVAVFRLQEENPKDRGNGRIVVLKSDFSTSINQINYRKDLQIRNWVISPDDRYLALASERGILFWEIETGKNGPAIPLNKHGLGGMLYSPDGKELIVMFLPPRPTRNDWFNKLDTGERYWEVKSFDTRTAKELRTWKITGDAPRNMSLSPDGKRLLSLQHSDCFIRDINTGNIQFRLRIPSTESQGTAEGDAGFFRMLTPDNTLWFGSRACATWSPDGKLIATGGSDGILRLWDAESGKELRTLRGHEGTITDVAFRPDGRVLASGGTDRVVRLWELDTGREIHTYRGHQFFLHNINFSPDGRQLSSTDAGGMVLNWDATVDPESLACQKTPGLVKSLVFLPGSRELVVGIAPPMLSPRRPSEVWIVDALSGLRRSLMIAPEMNASEVVCSPDGKTLALSGRSTKNLSSKTREAPIYLFKPSTQETVGILKMPGRSTNGLLFHPDGKHLFALSHLESIDLAEKATPKPGFLALWNIETRTKVYQVPTKPEPQSVALDPTRQWLAVVGPSRGIQLFDPKTGKFIREIPTRSGIRCVKFHPRLPLVATAGGEGIRLWDVATGKSIRGFRGALRNTYAIDFNPDGTRLASGSRENIVQIWNVADGEEFLTLRSHRHFVEAVAFSPDGNRLASGGFDGITRIWEAGPTDDESRKKRREAFFREASNWHDLQLEESVTVENWFAVHFHVDRLLAKKKDDPRLLYFKAWAFGGQNKFADAQKILSPMTKKSDADLPLVEMLAVLKLAQRDEPGYQEVCQQLASRLKTNSPSHEVNNIISHCCLAGGAVKDYAPLIKAMQKASREEDPITRNTLATVLYRAGRFDEARKLLVPTPTILPPLLRSIRRGDQIPQDFLVLALIDAKRKKPKEAKEWYDKALIEIKKEQERGRSSPWLATWMGRWELEHYRAEAEKELKASKD